MHKFPGVQLCNKYESFPEGEQRVIEPKLDGYRLSVCVGLDDSVSVHCREEDGPSWVDNVEHIVKAIVADGRFRGMMIDGEVQARGNWGSTSSLLRTKRDSMTSLQLDELEREARFAVFDAVQMLDVYPEAKRNERSRKLMPHDPTPLHARRKFLEDAARVRLAPELYVVPQFTVTSHSETLQLYQELLELEYEGGILKDPNAPYWFGRTDAWQKLKPFHTLEATVTGSLEGEGKHRGRLGSLHAVLNDGKTEVSIGTGFTDAQREDYWSRREELVGKVVEFTAQVGSSKTRHPAFVRLRVG